MTQFPWKFPWSFVMFVHSYNNIFIKIHPPFCDFQMNSHEWPYLLNQKQFLYKICWTYSSAQYLLSYGRNHFTYVNILKCLESSKINFAYISDDLEQFWIFSLAHLRALCSYPTSKSKDFAWSRILIHQGTFCIHF